MAPIKDPGHGHGAHLPFGTRFIGNRSVPSSNELIDPGKGASPGFGVTVDANVTGITIPDQGKGVAFDNRPAYYALYFIQKI